MHADARPTGNGLQIHNRYLVTENAEGLVVIDQHALHERILYEQLRRRVLAGSLESQRLLVPEPVSLSANEIGTVLDAKELLGQLGIEIEAVWRRHGVGVLLSGDAGQFSAWRGACGRLSNRWSRRETRQTDGIWWTSCCT